MTVLAFQGNLTLEGQTIYTEFALEAGRDQLAAILQALLAAPVTEFAPANKSTVSSNKMVVSSSAGLARFRRRPIVAEDIREDMAPEEKLAVIIEGFRESNDVKFLSMWARSEYRKLTGRPYKGEDVDELLSGATLPALGDEELDPDPVEFDLAKLRAIPRPELVKVDGAVNLSEIARRLKLPTGGSKWEYVKELGRYLQAEYDEAEANEEAA